MIQPAPAHYPFDSNQQWLYYLPAHLRDLVRIKMETRSYKRHDVIYDHRSQINEVYTVIDGSVRLTNTTESGKDIAITSLPPGCTFGELSFVDGLARQNIAIASTACTLAVLHKKHYLELCEQYGQIPQAMLQFVAHRLRALVNIHQDTTSLELPQQLAKRLLYIADNQQQNPSALTPNEINTSQDELAATLGVSRQHVNKAVKRWQSEGLIDVGYRKIILLDAEGLAKVAADA